MPATRDRLSFKVFRLVEGEAEFSLGIGFGVADLVHSGCQLDEDHFVAGGRFVSGAVGDGSVEGGGE